MKRMVLAGLVIGTLSVFGTVGCGEKSKTEKKTTVSTPGGSTTTTKTLETTQKGDNPPPADATK
jgi:uncharacterized lipoprotein